MFLLAAADRPGRRLRRQALQRRHAVGRGARPGGRQAAHGQPVLTLALEGHLPAWIAVLVIARDLLIVAGTLALRLLAGRFRVEPLFLVGKLSTFMQIVLGGAVLAELSVLPGLAPWLQPLLIVTALLVVASAAGLCPGGGADLVLARVAAVTAHGARRQPTPRPRRRRASSCSTCRTRSARSLTDFMPAASNRGGARRRAGLARLAGARLPADRPDRQRQDPPRQDLGAARRAPCPARPRALGARGAAAAAPATPPPAWSTTPRSWPRRRCCSTCATGWSSARGSLLLTARRPVAAWDLRLPDLRSRLLTAWPVRIEPPDDELLGALLVKQFADRQIRVDPEVVAFLVTRRIERSFAAARAVVHALDRASLRARRPITMPLARAVLEELAPSQDPTRERVMDLGISGRRAIVCAASKGLGRACAEALAENGVALVINARGADALEATAAEIRARLACRCRGRRRRHHARKAAPPCSPPARIPTSWSTTPAVRRPATSATGTRRPGWQRCAPTC